jgi:hypothetical protein
MMTKINFEPWLRGPPRAIGFPHRLAVLAGSAALFASLAMTAAPAAAHPAATLAEAGSAQSAQSAVDELSSRRHGAGSRASGGGRRGGILGGARGAFKKSLAASRGRAGRHHAGRSHASRHHAGRGYYSRQIAGRSRAGPPNFDPRAPGLARLQQGGGARSLGVFGTYRKPHKKSTYHHRRGDGFGKYGLQPDGGYSYGSGVGSKKSRHSGGRHRDVNSGGYGDRSFYKIRDTFRKAARHKKGRSHTPAYVGNYGGRSFGPRPYQ